MAYKHGTANSPAALWNALLAFLKSDPDLVAAGQQWTVGWTAPGGEKDGVVLIGPGASGTDSVMVSLRRVDTTGEDTNAIWMRGQIGIVDTATTVKQHAGISPEVGIFVDTNPMEYWFVASGRRFVVVVKMSTTYVSLYGGFFLPYANPITYGYPLMIGGSMPYNGDDSSGLQVKSWRDQKAAHSHFPFSVDLGGNNGIQDDERSSCYLLDNGGQWRNVGDQLDSAYNVAPYYFRKEDVSFQNPWRQTEVGSSDNNVGWLFQRQRIEENFGGGFSLEQFQLISTVGGEQMLGVMDGVFSCPGQGNAAQNIVQIAGVDYLVVQNVFRTDTRQYWALRLN